MELHIKIVCLFKYQKMRRLWHIISYLNEEAVNSFLPLKHLFHIQCLYNHCCKWSVSKKGKQCCNWDLFALSMQHCKIVIATFKNVTLLIMGDVKVQDLEFLTNLKCPVYFSCSDMNEGNRKTENKKRNNRWHQLRFFLLKLQSIWTYKCCK